MFNVDDRLRYICRTRDLAIKYFTGTPPLNFEALFNRLGVVEVRECQLDRDARIVPASNQGFIIEVNAIVSGARRRLSVAHELAHLIMWELDGDLRLGPSVERLCNELAGELLVPEMMLRQALSQQGTIAGWRDSINCSSIFAVSRQFGVSVEVAARRVFRDLDLMPESVAIIWRQFPISDRLRIASAWHSAKWNTFIPRRKRAPESSVILRAFASEGTFAAQEKIRLGSLTGTFNVHASGYMSFPLRSATPPDRAVLSLISKIGESNSSAFLAPQPELAYFGA